MIFDLPSFALELFPNPNNKKINHPQFITLHGFYQPYFSQNQFEKLKLVFGLPM
jgi:hypothetical protein